MAVSISTAAHASQQVSKKVGGIVFYRGPSMIDGSPIIGVATLQTANEKTGNLVQTWILREDMKPQEATRSGDDVAICGDCPLRGIIEKMADKNKNVGRGCYVLEYQAPNQVFRTYQAGGYVDFNAAEHADILAGRSLRYGAYGDPTAIPLSAWNPIAKACTGDAQPGYTHQWKDKRFKGWKSRVMASVHSREDAELAWALGWRTFRTVTSIADIGKGEALCPASAEAGFRKTCIECGACDGRHDTKSKQDKRVSIAIPAHGHGPRFKSSQLVSAR